MDPLLKAAEAHGIAVIEDAAQAIGAYDGNGRQAGSIGHMGCFSFFPSKNLGAFGDGGMVITHDERLAETLRMLRVHGGTLKYHHRIVGGNFRLDALQAAILRVKLKYLAGWTEARRTNAQRYRKLFQEMRLVKHVSLPEDVPGHVYNQFVVRVPDRDRLREFLRDCGVGTAIYYPLPLHLQECFKELGYRKGDFPQAEIAASESLALPMYPELTDAQQRYVVSQIKEFYNRN
jgi:dTDP-4-amino-4,6-dideoxygalactose transaminase